MFIFLLFFPSLSSPITLDSLLNDLILQYNTCQGLALISIITDDCFDTEHVTVLFCNDCEG